MKSERIYKAIGDADDKLLESYAVHPRAAKRQPLWVKWGAVAACACLVTVGAFAMGQNPLAEKNPAIISSYVTSQPGGVSAAAPENGKTFFFTNVKAAMDENAGKDATYFVAVNLYKDGVPLSSDSDEVQAELKRLTDNGYKAGYATSWTYQGNKVKTDVRYLAGFFTKDQLENFAVSDRYGYVFSFATNGDGSEVSADQELAAELVP